MLELARASIDEIPSPPLAPREPAVDLAHLFRMTLGDHDLEREVLQLFSRQADMLMGRMDGATPAGIAAMAHTLKGSARGIGAWRVAQAADALELAARGDGHGLETAVDALRAAAGETRTAIADLLAR